MNFDLAYSCKENKEVMRIASQRFRIPVEDKNQCRMLGLWDAVELFDSSRGVPFKLFLSLRVKFRCLKWCHENYDPKMKYIDTSDWSISDSLSKVSFKQKSPGGLGLGFFQKIDSDSIKKARGRSFFDEILISLDGKDKDLIVSRFIENRTLEDIGTQYDVSYETVRKWINVILEKLKE